MRAPRRAWEVAGLTLLVLGAAAVPASGQWQVEGRDGTASLRIGVLLQPQMESLETCRLRTLRHGAETGFFYAGTFQGTRRQAGFGAGFDVQQDSRLFSADAFFETPLADRRQGLTLQLNWMRYDGATFLPAFPKQDAYLLEAGYHLFNHRLSPFVQYQVRHFANPATPDQDSLQAGLAWWLAGHSRSLKLSAGRLHADGQPDRTQVLLQFQLFYF